MPKVRYIGAAAVACLVLGQPLLCHAQDTSTPPATTPTAPPAETKDAGKPAVQTPEDRPPPDQAPKQEADIGLLAKAMQSLGQTTTFFYEGDMEIKGIGKGLTFTGRERVRFTAKRPGKALADVMVTLGDAPSGKRYLTISDGANVWVERPGTRQYSVTEFDATEFTKNVAGLGILGSLYFNEKLLTGIGMITPDNAAQIVDLLKKQDIELSGEIQTIEGTDMPVFTMLLAKQKMTFRFVVDPKRAVFRRLEVIAIDNGMDFTMAETIVRQNPAPLLNKKTFKYVPPAGYSKTERVTVDLL